MEKVTNNQLDLTKIFNTSVEEQMKLEAIGRKAKETLKQNEVRFRIMQKAANSTVSTVQKSVQQQMEEAKKAAVEEYKKDLVAAGLSIEAYPIELAIGWADQNIAKKALGFLGKIGKFGASVGNYVKDGVKAGYNTK